jgi:hypothetical protein
VKRRSMSGPIVLIIALVAIPCALCLGAVGYWRYVDSVPTFTPQLPPMPRPNGYEMATKAVARLAGARRPKVPDHWPKVTPEQLRAQLAPVRPMLDEVRSYFRLEWRARPMISNSDLFPEYSQFRECARCFVAESLLSRHRGDIGGAMQRSLDAVELGSRVPRGGEVLASFVGQACQAIGFDRIEPLVPRLSPDGVVTALKRVRRIRQSWPPLAETLECERISELACWGEFFQDFQRQPLRRKLETLRGCQDEPSFFGLATLALAPRRSTLASLDEYWQRRVAESRKPFPQRAVVPTPNDPWLQFMLRYVEDEPKRTWQFEWPATQLAILEVALAVRLYRLEHGRYPTDLRAIEDRWLPAVPVDQWGQPVANRLKGGKPLIYSLGPDRKDDGGLAANVRHLGKTARGDLVFGKLTWSAWPEESFYGPQSGER